MCDYKEMYLTLMQASEKSINILIEAQRKAEEIYISYVQPEVKIININKEKETKKPH